MKPMKVTVLTGGTSSERDVALASAVQVIGALRGCGHDVAVVDTARGYIPEATESTMLSGLVGIEPPSIEELHALGVTSFEQIAAWDDAEIDRIDAQLGRFAGRIRRDAWTEQARLLSAGDTAGYEAKFGKL